MAIPSTTELTKAYLEQQIARTLSTLDKITSRENIASGRVIPSADDLAIHDGRRLTATVLFLDICKFSARSSSTEQDQQNLLQILSFFFTEMIKIIEDYGGVVEKNTGDGLMAYFVKQSNDSTSAQQLALSAALTMFSAASLLINPVLQQSNITPLDFRICLDHGPITIAKVGATRGFNGIVAIGATANIASKMLAFADPNTILVGSDVLPGVPEGWRLSFVELKTAETGWLYTATNSPYSFWQYKGRWKVPQL